MSEAELLTVLLRAAAQDVPGGPITPPGPDLVARAHRRFVRRRGALVALAAVAALAVAVPIGLAAGAAKQRPQPASPTPYATTGPGTAAALAHGSWTDLPQVPLAERAMAASAWTGTEMLIWGGYGGPNGQLSYDDGAAYDPVHRNWRRLPPAPMSARSGMAYAWTGRELLIWGGGTSTSTPTTFDDGAAYDPASNSWRKLASSPLDARRDAKAMWVSGRFVVLGGQPAIVIETRRAYFDGASYDPVADRWQTLPSLPSKPDEGDDDMFATAGDSALYVLARWHHNTPLPDGRTSTTGGLHFFGYDIRGGSWSRLPTPPPGTGVEQLVWSGREVLVPAAGSYLYGGMGPPQLGLHGNRYDPDTRRWSAMAHGPADDLRGQSIWTGAALLTFNTGTYTSSGSTFSLPGNAAAWDPTSQTWEPLPNAGWTAMYPAAVWTGAQLLVWGRMNTVAGAGPKVGPATAHGLAFAAVPPDAPEAIKAPAAMKLDHTDEFGIVPALHRSAGSVTIDVDRVDMISGPEAVAAAKARGKDPLIDYFLVNDNHRLRRYPVSPRAVVWGSISLSRTVEPTRSSLAAWYRFLATPAAKDTLFHFEVAGGVVIGVEEQYRP